MNCLPWDYKNNFNNLASASPSHIIHPSSQSRRTHFSTTNVGFHQLDFGRNRHSRDFVEIKLFLDSDSLNVKNQSLIRPDIIGAHGAIRLFGRNDCRHFAAWLHKLNHLGKTGNSTGEV